MGRALLKSNMMRIGDAASLLLHLQERAGPGRDLSGVDHKQFRQRVLEWAKRYHEQSIEGPDCANYEDKLNLLDGPRMHLTLLLPLVDHFLRPSGGPMTDSELEAIIKGVAPGPEKVADGRGWRSAASSNRSGEHCRAHVAASATPAGPAAGHIQPEQWQLLPKLPEVQAYSQYSKEELCHILVSRDTELKILKNALATRLDLLPRANQRSKRRQKRTQSSGRNMMSL